MSTIKRFNIFILLSLMVFVIFACFNSILQVKADTWTWKDEFTDQNARWNWSYVQGTGYHLLTTIDGYSVAESGITSASSTSIYSDCALVYNQAISASDRVIVEVRAKFSHTMTQSTAKGSQGTGLWDGTYNNFAFFFDCSNESQEGFGGFRALMVIDRTVYVNTVITIDQTDWHVYRLELNSSGTFMFIDKVLIASATHRPTLAPVCRLTIWVDNAAYSWDTTKYLDVVENQKVYVDYAIYHYNDSSAIPEFPSWISISFIMVAALTLGLVYRKKSNRHLENIN